MTTNNKNRLDNSLTLRVANLSKKLKLKPKKVSSVAQVQTSVRAPKYNKNKTLYQTFKVTNPPF